MSIFASILRSVYKLSGAKKVFALPEDALRKEIEKQNRHRGVFTPTDRKAYYETIAVNGFPCLIVREHQKPSERAILYFFDGGMVIGPDKGDLPVMRKLCRETGCDVWFPFYPLCMEHCITETYAMVYECYRRMVGLYGGGNVSTCGFSSGGALALGIAAHNNAQPEPLPQPRHIVAVSPGEVPWNDVEKSRMKALNERDVSIDYAFMVTVEKFMRHGCDKWHDYEMSVAPYDKDKPIYYEFTSCPAAEFAIRHGLTDIMPALCNVDFASMELLHAKLIRTNTCVNGCRCDYTICGDKDPYVKSHPEYRDEAGFRRNK